MRRKPAPEPRSKHGSSPVRRGAPEPKRQTALAALRNEIDGVDREIVKRVNELASKWCDLVVVMNRRAEIATRIGKVKEQQGLEVWSPAREEEVLAKALASN